MWCRAVVVRIKDIYNKESRPSLGSRLWLQLDALPFIPRSHGWMSKKAREKVGEKYFTVANAVNWCFLWLKVAR